tara:strand:+ start:3916 stop:4146 length:231 start_codon:yes stop_codon:yes gene_type:complete
MVIVTDADRTEELNISCVDCNKVYQIKVRPEDLVKHLKKSGYVQDIFFYLDASERELLISQVCGSCFDETFPADYD